MLCTVPSELINLHNLCLFYQVYHLIIININGERDLVATSLQFMTSCLCHSDYQVHWRYDGLFRRWFKTER